MPITLINPLDETVRAEGKAALRLAALEGKTIGLLDISKPGGSIFLDRLEMLLKERYKVGRFLREMKPTFARPAPDEIIARLAGAHAVIEALAD